MESESKTSLLPLFIGVLIIATSATGYILLLKSPPDPAKNRVLSKNIEVSPTPGPTTTPTPITKSLPAIDYPNTNFISATATASQYSITDPKSCEQFDPTNATSPIQTSTFHDQTVFYQTSGTVEGTVVTETRQYHLPKDNICEEKTLTLKTTNIRSIDPAKKIKAVDTDLIWQRLESLLP